MTNRDNSSPPLKMNLNGSRRLGHVYRPTLDQRTVEMKKEMDHEDIIVHSRKFYRIFGSLSASGYEAETLFVRTSPHSLI